MNNSQKNELIMNKRAKTCLERSEIATILALIPEYAAFKAALDANILTLESLQDMQFSLRKGLFANKILWREKITPPSLTLAAALVALGSKLEDTAILEEATFTASFLRNMSYAAVAAKGQILCDLGTANETGLAIYNITPAFLVSYQKTIDSFKAAIEASNSGMDEQKRITRDINLGLKATAEALFRIAIIFETLKDTQPASYEMFRNAIRVYTAPVFTLSATGYVLDDETGLPIKKCRLKVTSVELLQEPPGVGGEPVMNGKSTTSVSSELTKTVKLTSALGGFRYKNLANGTYEVTAFRSGYTDLPVTFHVNNGECAEVYFRMQKTKQTAA